MLWQNFAAAVRPVFFDTDIEEWRYGTHGGTLFLVEHQQRVFALTCRQVFRDFLNERLFISGEYMPRKGARPAPVKSMAFPSAPIGEAQGTDVGDLCVIEFADDIEPNFFHGTAYRLDPQTIGTSRPGDKLLVAGVLKEKTTLIPPSLDVGYCRLEFIDTGQASFGDPFLRQAVAAFPAPAFESLTGISGSPVFDVTANVLCGMVCRAAMQDNRAKLYYFDFFDVMKFVEAAANRAPNMNYSKTL
jgi:hypothetical protein